MIVYHVVRLSDNVSLGWFKFAHLADFKCKMLSVRPGIDEYVVLAGEVNSYVREEEDNRR
jgi:hypothetical protein